MHCCRISNAYSLTFTLPFFRSPTFGRPSVVRFKADSVESKIRREKQQKHAHGTHRSVLSCCSKCNSKERRLLRELSQKGKREDIPIWCFGVSCDPHKYYPCGSIVRNNFSRDTIFFIKWFLHLLCVVNKIFNRKYISRIYPWLI